MPTATPDRPTAPPPNDDVAVRGSAFGLDLEASFPIPGVSAAPAGAPRPRPVRLDLASRAELLSAWDPADPRRLSHRRLPNGRAYLTIDADPVAGYLIKAQGFGCFWISADARRIRCAPLRISTWRWQRYLVGQLLPLAAVLNGLEVFHASAVLGPGGAMAFLGYSTAGKTSVALNLVLRGARFMTDDVLAVSPAADGGVTAHPGVGLASLRHEAAGLLDAADRRRVGRRLGRDAEASRVELERQDAAVPLRHAFMLERGGDGPLVIEPLRPVDPRLLLGGSFNFIIYTRERLTNQLDLCARLATRVAVHRAVIPPSVGPAELAAAVERYVEETGT